MDVATEGSLIYGTQHHRVARSTQMEGDLETNLPMMDGAYLAFLLVFLYSLLTPTVEHTRPHTIVCGHGYARTLQHCITFSWFLARGDSLCWITKWQPLHDAYLWTTILHFQNQWLLSECLLSQIVDLLLWWVRRRWLREYEFLLDNGMVVLKVLFPEKPFNLVSFEIR